MCHGTLLDFLRKGEGQHLQLPSLLDAAAQIASGMRYLEEEGYINLDLRAGMIFVGGNFVYKVAGFPFIRLLNENKYIMNNRDVYPVKWTAPESIRFRHCTIKSNVWSFAVLLTELVTKGMEPYPGMTNDAVTTEVERGYRMECPIGCSRSLYEIMLKCWNKNPEERPSFEFLKVTLEDCCVAAEEG